MVQPYGNGEMKIEPAYDMTFAYAPGNRWLSGHQMTIGGKTAHISDEDLIGSGKIMGLGRSFCKRVLQR